MMHAFPTLDQLLTGPGWAFLASANESDLDDWGLSLLPESITVRTVRGQRCATKERLLQEFAAALQFPHYFGENWDAFEDCLSDLSWLGDLPLLLIVANADRVLPDAPEDFKTFVSILTTIGSGEIAVFQNLLLHADPAAVHRARERYAAAGLPLPSTPPRP